MDEELRQDDVITLEITPVDRAERKPIHIGMSSILGTRKSQQDTMFGQLGKGGAIGIVCDGMGGLQGGDIASQLAAETLARDYYDREHIDDISAFLMEEAKKIDRLVFELEDEESGDLFEAGTTMVTAIIEGENLFWLSVGDSRIYIIRGKEILAVNRMHNYRMTLDAQLEAGEITQEVYTVEEKNAEALISYIGMGSLQLMEINPTPFRLRDEDIILLCSDGLYRTLSELDILEIVRAYAPDMKTTAVQLTDTVQKRATGNQDNTSVVLMQYKEEEQ